MMSKVNNIAHRLVPLCLLLVALSGCRKEDTPAPDTPSGTPIAFTPETATKAAVSGKEDIQNDPNGFRVWGWFQGTPGTDDTPVFDGTSVTYVDDNWTYQHTRYWMNGIYNFAAVYPASVSATYAAADGALALTVADFDVTDQHDLLVAFNNGTDGTGINGATPPSFVDLNFKHALTKINLKISQNFSEVNGDPDNDYIVKKVTLSGVYKSGTYIATPTGTSESDYTQEWNFTSTTATFEKVYDTPIKLREVTDENNNIIPLLVWEDALLLLPQEIAADAVRIQIDYTYHLQGDDEGTNDKERTVEAYIPATENLWQSGKHITYSISIASPTNIVFVTPSIQPWSTPQPGGTIII